MGYRFATVLGSYLKRKRMESGLSQRDVSEKFGYTTPQFISNWERGQAAPPKETYKMLIKLYGLDLREFYKVLVKAKEEEIRGILSKQKKTKGMRDFSVSAGL